MRREVTYGPGGRWVGGQRSRSRVGGPLLVRPLHRWFFYWEDRIPSLHRVVAVGVGAAATTALAAPLVGLRRLWLAAPGALLAWVVGGVVQEHDERVARPVDAAFAAALRASVDDGLAAAGFVCHAASGGSHARGQTADVFLYEAEPSRHPDLIAEGDDSGCLDLWIRRDVHLGQMDVSLGGHDLRHLLHARGRSDLAERIDHASDAHADAAALADAFAVLF